jgi:hypothetical protein
VPLTVTPPAQVTVRVAVTVPSFSSTSAGVILDAILPSANSTDRPLSVSSAYFWADGLKRLEQMVETVYQHESSHRAIELEPVALHRHVEQFDNGAQDRNDGRSASDHNEV